MARGLTIEFDDSEVLKALEQLSRRMTDMTPAMREISEILQASVEDAFESETDPATGQRWTPLSEVTVRLRDGNAHPILQRSGQLASSFQPDYGRDFAVVGTNKVQAGTHQFGASKGQFGRTSRGAPIPWGDIPARPMLGVSEAAGEDILEAVQRYLAGN